MRLRTGPWGSNSSEAGRGSYEQLSPDRRTISRYMCDPLLRGFYVTSISDRAQIRMSTIENQKFSGFRLQGR